MEKRSGVVAHQGGEAVELAFHTVQRGEHFALAGGPGGDADGFFRGAFDQHVIIEGVQGFADFQHGVIGGVDHVIDGAHAVEFQTALHACRAWTDLNVADQPAIKRGFISGPVIFRVTKSALPAGGCWSQRGRLERFAGDRGDLACQPEHRSAAGKGRQQVDLDHRVAQNIRQRRTGDGVVLEE